MGKHKAEGKAKKKGSQLVIRLEKGERDAFVKLCERLDTSAASEIRRFMRELVAAHEGEVLISGVGLDSAESVETVDEVPAVDAVIAPEPVAEVAVPVDAKLPVDEAEKPKKKLRRA